MRRKFTPSACSLAASASLLALVLSGASHAATFNWSNGATGNWSSTSPTTDWKSATVPNAAGAVVRYTHTGNASAGGSVTLDQDATVGIIDHQTGVSASTGVFTVARSGGFALTMDNSGGGNSLFGNNNAAIIGNGNSNTYNITRVHSDIVIANTDLDIGSISGGVLIGTSANSNSITASTDQNLNLRWNAGNTGRPMTVNAAIGTSGAGTITLNHYGSGVGTHTMNLNGVIGAKVGAIIQDTSVSILSLNADNSAFVGSILLKSGTLSANHANALGSSGDITFSGGTLRYTAASAGQDWAPRFKNSGSPITLDTNGRSVTLSGIDATNTAGLNKSGTGTLTLSGSNSFTGPTTVNTGTLRLGNGTTSASLSDSDAVIVSGGTLELNYSGTDTIRELWLNGTQMPPGVHGASDPSGLLTGAGTLTVTGTADVLPSAPGQKPGLREGMLAVAFNLTDPNPGHEVPLSTRMADTATGWTENTTWLYTGEIHLDGGTYVFAEHFDDSVSLCIDGQVVLNDGQSSISTDSSLTLPAGWHTIELRLGNTSGAAGPSSGGLSGLGVAWKKQGDATWNPLADSGDGSFLRTTYTAGLRAGWLSAAFNTTDVNPGTLIKPGAELADTGSGWFDLTTWIYSGEIYLGSGFYTFAENFADSVSLTIDGQSVLNDAQSSVSTNRTLSFEAGWHSFELRLGNTAGAAGPSGSNLGGLGVAWRKNGALVWNAFANPESGILLRTPTVIDPSPFQSPTQPALDALNHAREQWTANPPPVGQTVKRGGVLWLLEMANRHLVEGMSDPAKLATSISLSQNAEAALADPSYGAFVNTRPELCPTIRDMANNPGAEGLFEISAFNSTRPAEPTLNGATLNEGDSQKLAYAVCHPQSPAFGSENGVVALLTTLHELFMVQGAHGWGESPLGISYVLLQSAFPSLLTSTLDPAWKDVMRTRANTIANNYRSQAAAPDYVSSSWVNAHFRDSFCIGYYGLALNDAPLKQLMSDLIRQYYLTLQPDGATNYTGYQNEAQMYHGIGLAAMYWMHLFIDDPATKELCRKYVHHAAPYRTMASQRFVTEEFTAPAQKHYYNTARAGEAYVGHFAGDPFRVASSLTLADHAPTAFSYDPDLPLVSPPENYFVYDRNLIGVRGNFGLMNHAFTTRDFSYYPGKTAPGGRRPGLGFGVTTLFGMRLMHTPAEESAGAWPVNAILERVMNHAIYKGNDLKLGQEINGSVAMSGRAAALGAQYQTSTRAWQNVSWEIAPFLNQQAWIATDKRAIGLMRIESQIAGAADLQSGFEFVGGRSGQWGGQLNLTETDPGTYQFGKFQLSILETTYPDRNIFYSAGGLSEDTYRGNLRLLRDNGGVQRTVSVGENEWCFVEVKAEGTPAATNARRLSLPSGLYGIAFNETDQEVALIYNPTTSTQPISHLASTDFAHHSLHVGGAGLVDRAKYLNRRDYELARRTDSGDRSLMLASNSVSYALPPGRVALIVSSNDPADHPRARQYYEDVFSTPASLTSLQSWRKENFGSVAGEGVAHEAEDPDRDGLVNLVEFALGSSPLASDPDYASLRAVPTADALHFDHRRNANAAASGVVSIVEWSDDLQSWQSDGVTTEVLGTTGSVQTLRHTLPKSPDGRRFVRLRIEGGE
ncbi:MAG: hypothetical protein EAZ65_04170 [Verrucomicrobia bacterium]|nr:MAG: hypothetical protein EAZ82_04850 [Verrucomicrobiota bacterium]TAF27019.1 MAG: hypothetical protein EAZ71_04165 [Verrucomicrobiota bacterium]TAF42275.1 MAG: hypothetical protein EAZ65_04170 [Verrucomicrobiota bacterium]